MPKNQTLPTIAVALLVPIVAWAQGPVSPAPGTGQPPVAAKPAPAAAKEPPTEAETALDEAVKKVAALKSVSADVLQKVDMLDQKFDIEGRYLKAPNHRIYLSLSVIGLPDASGKMVQVCDGETLWDFQQILDSQMYSKIAVAQVFEKLNSPELDAEIRNQVSASLGFAGPEELLSGLRKAVKFDQKESGTLDGKEVWVIRGVWRSRDGLLTPNNQAYPANMPLPAYVPSLVNVWIGKDDGWPYKVVFVGKKPTLLQQDTRKIGPDGRPIGSKATIQQIDPTRIVLTYSNVKLNPELKVDDFAFQSPPGTRVDDRTQQLVSVLDQAIQATIARKKAEAAKSDDPLLKQSIDIPTSGALPGSEPAPSTLPGAPK